MTKVERVQTLVVERIRRGEYPVGAMLPSLRVLAEELGAHLNTVAQAYRELAERSIVRSEQGRGTFVLTVPDSTPTAAAIKTLKSELSRLALLACEVGMDPDAFVQLAKEVSSAQRGRGSLRAFFVECNPFDTEEVAESISRLLQLRVVPLLVDELQSRAEELIRSAHLFITTPFHIDEVEAAVGSATHVINVNVTPTTRSLVELARITEEERVAVVGSNERTVAQLVRLVRMQARLNPSDALLVDAPGLHEFIRAADVVVDSQSVHARVAEFAVSQRVVTVHFQLEANSAAFLEARMRDLFPEFDYTTPPWALASAP